MTVRGTKIEPPEDRKSASSHELPLGRAVRFGSIVSAILLTTNVFVCGTAGHFFGVSDWYFWQLIPGALEVGFVATTILGFRYSNLPLRLIYAVSAAWLGTLNFAFFASIACWIAGIVGWLAGWPVSHFSIAAVLFASALAVSIYGLINAAWLRVTSVTIKLPHLPEAWRGRTIALVTDLHLGHISGPGFLRRIIAKLRSLEPDAVLISGDMFDGTPVGIDRHIAPWSEFTARRGVYYITGNHDEFADRRIFLEAVNRTGLRILNNEMVSLDGLQIVGVHDSEATDAEELRAILHRVKLNTDLPSILLAHQPANLGVARDAGISLQLSGHTHRGQMWPWNLLVRRIYGPFAYGLHRLGNLQVYTSSGTGTWGPPLRVGTKSEIVLIRFD